MENTAKKPALQPATQYAVADSLQKYGDFFSLCYEKGWTDGLPVCPPTQEAVEAMLRYTDRGRHEVVAIVPPRNGAATVEKIAISAVMAGCLPEYLPVLITALEAMVEPEYNLYGRQTTTHPGAHLLIVHGPIRKELDVNCRQNVFGHGWRANATMGRALRLMMINIGGNKPGVTDMATHGHPGKYSYCIGEDEEGSPWEPFHTGRGIDKETSAVTVICAEPPHNINDQKSRTPYRYLASAASAMAQLGANGPYRSGIPSEQMLVMSPESAKWVADFGWSKRDVQTFIFERARNTIRDLRDRGCWDMSPLPKWIDPEDEDAMVPIVGRLEDIMIIVAGGHQRHMNAVLTAGYNLSVTKPILKKDGAPLKSVQEFL